MPAFDKPLTSRKHRPFLGSEAEISSVTLQKDVSFVSPSPTGLWDEEGLRRSLTVCSKDIINRSFNYTQKHAFDLQH